MCTKKITSTVQERNISRHNGWKIEGPIEPLYTIVWLCLRAFSGALDWAPKMTRVSRIALLLITVVFYPLWECSSIIIYNTYMLYIIYSLYIINYLSFHSSFCPSNISQKSWLQFTSNILCNFLIQNELIFWFPKRVYRPMGWNSCLL